MGELPSGTVSMLFSDIEGSTLLLSRLGSGYLDALDDHRRIMRAAWVAHGGTEMGTEGDSFFVAFRTAGDAVQAAVQAQRALAGHQWPAGEAVRVRIGVHTGSPQIHDDDYWGMDVHRAARIAAAAHGGQVLVSAAAADLARPEMPDGVGLRDLGSHHLKDIPAPEHLFQLDVPGLLQDFPAPRTIGTSTSLPRPATPLIGRDAEVAELTTLLTSSTARLVTLSGTGGSGKTRLAVGVAERLVTRFPDGVHFVPLAAVSTAEVMWSSVAEALDVPPRERTPDRVLAFLESRSTLLVLDNLEQVVGADEVVERLVAGAPRVAVLATSRRPLGLLEERRFPTAPLPVPEEPSLREAERSGAVQLFVQRAVTVQPQFRLSDRNVGEVVAICRRLDGLPLAIELCASRIRVLGPKALLARLDQALDMRSTSRLAPTRQQTLRDTIAWSYALLAQPDQAFFGRLSIFPGGGGDLAAIQAVTSPTGEPALEEDVLEQVARLVDASLVEALEGPDGEPRVRMLETIRAFGQEQLREAGELHAVREAHARHFADVAERLQARRTTGHLAALGVAETELDNLRQALAWALPVEDAEPSRGALMTGLRLCGALGWLWWAGGFVHEGEAWFERVVARAAGSPSPQLAACLSGLADLLLLQGEFDRAHDLAEQGLSMARSLGDEDTEGFALAVLGTTELHRGDMETARTTLHGAAELHRQRRSHGMLARVLGHLGGIEEARGDLDRAQALLEESLTILDALGDVHMSVVQRQNLANLLVVADRADEAREVAQGLVDTVLELRNPSLTMAFANTWMNILIRLHDPQGAARMFGAEEAMHDRLAMPNPYQREELEEALDLVAGVMTPAEWDRHRELGRTLRVEDLLVHLKPT